MFGGQGGERKIVEFMGSLLVRPLLLSKTGRILPNKTEGLQRKTNTGPR